jgi:hypothetical protein
VALLVGAVGVTAGDLDVFMTNARAVLTVF